MVASLDEAFNTNLNPIKVKTKKNKRKDIIQPEHLKNVNTNEFIHQENNFVEQKNEAQQINAYDTNYVRYYPLNKLDRRPQSNRNEDEKKVTLTNAQYQDYVNLQKERYLKNQGNKRSDIVEGFDRINDDFNDVLLFALTGIFFIIFTDYVYKLGKKSY